ncbi:hypothetical protein D3C71_2000620 [compost metagenome]
MTGKLNDQQTLAAEPDDHRDDMRRLDPEIIRKNQIEHRQIQNRKIILFIAEIESEVTATNRQRLGRRER